MVCVSIALISLIHSDGHGSSLTWLIVREILALLGYSEYLNDNQRLEKWSSKASS